MVHTYAMQLPAQPSFILVRAVSNYVNPFNATMQPGLAYKLSVGTIIKYI